MTSLFHTLMNVLTLGFRLNASCVTISYPSHKIFKGMLTISTPSLFIINCFRFFLNRLKIVGKSFNEKKIIFFRHIFDKNCPTIYFISTDINHFLTIELQRPYFLRLFQKSLRSYNWPNFVFNYFRSDIFGCTLIRKIPSNRNTAKICRPRLLSCRYKLK